MKFNGILDAIEDEYGEGLLGLFFAFMFLFAIMALTFVILFFAVMFRINEWLGTLVLVSTISGVPFWIAKSAINKQKEGS